MKNSFYIALVLLCSACASSSEIYTPTGAKGYALNCSGLARNWNMCLEKAGEICGEKGYTILNKNEEDRQHMQADNSGLFATNVKTRNMMIECKE